MADRSSKLTILWVSMNMGKSITSEFISEAMGLLMTLGYLRLFWSTHPMYYRVSYRHVSEAALSMLLFFFWVVSRLPSCCECIEHSG